jgi:two-component system KDP operon response regulator KdpE
VTPPPARILVVDDEPEILRALRSSLTHRGYEVVTAERGDEALARVRSNHPDAILIDLGLPDLHGVEVIRRIRADSSVPIVVLSARGDEQGKVEALDVGADDYVTKPFGVEELLARLRAALRRGTAPSPARTVFRLGAIVVDAEQRAVTVEGRPVHLTPIEYGLLRALCEQPNRVLTHGRLLRTVWGDAYASEGHYLHVHIANLRRKIEPNPRAPVYLLTEPGVGYRLRSDDD